MKFSIQSVALWWELTSSVKELLGGGTFLPRNGGYYRVPKKNHLSPFTMPTVEVTC